jgi:hypothetical protein
VLSRTILDPQVVSITALELDGKHITTYLCVPVSVMPILLLGLSSDFCSRVLPLGVLDLASSSSLLCRGNSEAYLLPEQRRPAEKRKCAEIHSEQPQTTFRTQPSPKLER